MRLQSLVTVALFTISVILFSSGPSFAQEWIKYVDRDERFIVNLPAEPEVTDISYLSEYGASLPARVYVTNSGSSRYSVTVIDYTEAESLLRERSERTGEPFRGDDLLGDVLGSIAYAARAIRQRGGEVTYDAWAAIDRIAGHQLQITNADESRTFAGIYLHASRLYVLEANVPSGWPPPGHFQQSLGILDEEGRRVRYTLDVDGRRTRSDTSYEWVGIDDPESETAIDTEAEVQPPDLTGVWSTNSMDTLENPAWDIEGLFSCRCAAETYEYLQSLLFDPSNDQLSAKEILDALEVHTSETIADRLTDTGREVGSAFDLGDDPAIQCERFGVFRTVLHSDPIEFEVHDDRILLRGEDLTVDRIVYMDGRGHPVGAPKSAAGHSIGWYEGRTLVVETVDVEAGLADDQLAIHNSDQARSIERYTASLDGSRLDVAFTMYDPVMLREPLTIERPRVFTPDLQLEHAPCEAISGQF